MLWQRVLVALAAPYVAWLVFCYEYHFLDGVNLAFHEAGHLFLSFGGQTLHVLGGTLGQLFFPVACALHFLRSERPFEATLMGVWGAESLMNVARYLGDAQAQALPLVAGDIHDWHWLLAHFGGLSACRGIALALHLLASALAIACLAAAARIAFAAGERAPGRSLAEALAAPAGVGSAPSPPGAPPPGRPRP
jgi:hypothetical protein